MVKHLLSVAAVAALACGSAFAQEATVERYGVVADTWVRSSSPAETNRGTADKLEIRKEAIYEGEGDDKVLTGYHNYVGLMGFDFSVPAGLRVSKATLHFVTERFKGSYIYVRPYGHDFAENCCWNDEESYITAALEAETLYEGDLAGQWNKATFDNNLAEDKQNLEAWTNDVDVTNYVKTMHGRVNFIFSQDNVDNKAVVQQNCIYSKEAKDLTNNNYPEFTATAAELVPYLEVEFEEDSNSGSVTVGTVADTQIRKNNTNNYGANADLEIKKTADGQEFYALLEFALPAEALDAVNYEVNSASLRLVFTQNKGKRPMQLFAYNNTVVENTTFAAEEANVRAAFEADPVAEFNAAGCGGWAMTDDRDQIENYKTADTWTNNVDITDYVKNLSASRAIATGHVSFLLTKATEENDAMRVASKEAVDKVNEKRGFTIKAADLVPQLTVNYTKKGSTGIEDVTVADENAPVEYYNLQGVRISEPAAGQIVIRRQGKSVSKIYVK